VSVPDDIDSMMSKGSNPIKQYLKDDTFKLHPDWIYCRGNKKSFEDMKLGQIDPENCEMTPEEELAYYFEKFESTGWKWKQDKLDLNDTKCDRKLLNLLLFDAKVTENFPPDISKRLKDLNLAKLQVQTSFIATHSGLLRFKVFNKKISAMKFANNMKRSIDEIWYKRAVEFNRINPQSYVYSVAFNAYDTYEPRITATQAVFAQDKTPVAVVGFQFAHGSLETMMEVLVSTC
jgi:voltage-dependent calcium channel alpha-2/delta-3